jgi:hypothetical protein
MLNNPLQDEVVNEVRMIREAHAARFNYDLKAIYADLKKSQNAHIESGKAFIPVPHTLAPSYFNRFNANSSPGH